MNAVSVGNLDLVLLLLERGADANVQEAVSRDILYSDATS